MQELKSPINNERRDSSSSDGSTYTYSYLSPFFSMLNTANRYIFGNSESATSSRSSSVSQIHAQEIAHRTVVNSPMQQPPVAQPPSEEKKENIPLHLQCRVTHQIYRKPVIIMQTGAVIEQEVFTPELIKVCPRTNENLTSWDYKPAWDILDAVEEYLRYHPEKDNEGDRYPIYHAENKSNSSQTPVSADNQEAAEREVQQEERRNGAYCATLSSYNVAIRRTIFFGGVVVAFYYGIKAIPCYHEAWKNFTGGPLSFTSNSYGKEYGHNSGEYACMISPWQNVTANSSISLTRGENQHCQFYTTEGIKIRTTAFSVSASGTDADGCSIEVKKGSARCSWNFFKTCPNQASNMIQETSLDAQESEPEITSHLRKRAASI